MKIYYASNRNCLRTRAITRKAKVNVYKTIFCLILTCSCESWVPTTDIRSRIQAAEIKYLRRIKPVTRRDRVRNELVRDVKVESTSKTKRTDNNSSSLVTWWIRPVKTVLAALEDKEGEKRTQEENVGKFNSGDFERKKCYVEWGAGKNVETEGEMVELAESSAGTIKPPDSPTNVRVLRKKVVKERNTTTREAHAFLAQITTDSDGSVRTIVTVDCPDSDK